MILITNAEKEISSGLAGLLVATVPIFVIFTSMRGDHSVWQPKRIFGLVVGFIDRCISWYRIYNREQYPKAYRNGYYRCSSLCLCSLNGDIQLAWR